MRCARIVSLWRASRAARSGFPCASFRSFSSRVGRGSRSRGNQPLGDAVVVALVLGTIAAASSPAVHSGDDERARRRRTSRTCAVRYLGGAGPGRGHALRPGARGRSRAHERRRPERRVAGTVMLQLGGSIALGTLLGVALAATRGCCRGTTVLLLGATAFVAVVVAWLTRSRS